MGCLVDAPFYSAWMGIFYILCCLALWAPRIEMGVRTQSRWVSAAISAWAGYSTPYCWYLQDEEHAAGAVGSNGGASGAAAAGKHQQQQEAQHLNGGVGGGVDAGVDAGSLLRAGGSGRNFLPSGVRALRFDMCLAAQTGRMVCMQQIHTLVWALCVCCPKTGALMHAV